MLQRKWSFSFPSQMSSLLNFTSWFMTHRKKAEYQWTFRDHFNFSHFHLQSHKTKIVSHYTSRSSRHVRIENHHVCHLKWFVDEQLKWDLKILLNTNYFDSLNKMFATKFSLFLISSARKKAFCAVNQRQNNNLSRARVFLNFRLNINDSNIILKTSLNWH